MNARSLRLRMMAFYCAVMGVLLALSLTGFYFVVDRVLREQLDRGLRDTAAPVIADVIVDPSDTDVDQLNIKGQYFEVIDDTGRVWQRSRNLPVDLPLPDSEFGTISVKDLGQLRVGVIPFVAEGRQYQFVAAASTRDIDAALRMLRHSGLVLLPLGLLLTAAVSGMWAFNRLFERLEKAVGQLRQFVSDASHELRTPLSILQGETELLAARPRSTADYANAIRVIDSELKKLNHIVEGLFTLSMADAGQFRVAAEPLYLEEVLEETCSMAAPLANHKQIRIERDLQKDVLYSGDATFLRQLFLIFIDNAIKYSPPGSRLNVSLTADREVKVRFEDEGVGIAKEHLSRIFERFFRVSPTGSGDTQSGGLGLAIAQAIVRAHRGTIECESQLGTGSVFTVRLPRTV